MSGGTVRITLVGGPLDGYAHPIPTAEAGVNTRTYVTPRVLSIVDTWQAEDVIPEQPKHLHYRPMLADIGTDRPVLSTADDGAMRYEYVGEW